MRTAMIASVLSGLVFTNAFASSTTRPCEAYVKSQYVNHYDSLGGKCTADRVSYSKVERANTWIPEPGISVLSFRAEGSIQLSCNGQQIERPFRVILELSPNEECLLRDATPWSSY